MQGQAVFDRVGDYTLIQFLGSGSGGAVYKARQPGLERTIAVKILDSKFPSAEDRRRFYVEAKAAARLTHPGIVAIHEIGESDGKLFYSMDFIDGRTIADVIKHGPLASREAARLIQQIAEAMDHAHAHNVLHRDLKPSNILVNAQGQPRITDFGLAKCTAEDNELTRSGQILGTPAYMSPEQAAGRIKEVGTASDVYGIGSVLYAMLTGRSPFQAATAPEVLRQVIDELPVAPRQINAGVDLDLQTICLKCLEKQPAERYASARELTADLTRYLQGDPITARPQGVGRVAWHWARRPQRAPQAALIIFIVAAFYGVWSVMGFAIVLFDLIPMTRPTEAALIVGLDSTGFLLCSVIGIGVLKRNRWLTRGGVVVSVGMLAIIAALIITEFKAGGILEDPFVRFSIYTIFGFVAVLFSAACIIASVSQQPYSGEDSVQYRIKSSSASTLSQAGLTSTVDLNGKRNE